MELYLVTGSAFYLEQQLETEWALMLEMELGSALELYLVTVSWALMLVLWG